MTIDIAYDIWEWRNWGCLGPPYLLTMDKYTQLFLVKKRCITDEFSQGNAITILYFGRKIIKCSWIYRLKWTWFPAKWQANFILSELWNIPLKIIFWFFKYKVYFLSIYDKISKGQFITKWIASCQEALMVVHLGIIHQGY